MEQNNRFIRVKAKIIFALLCFFMSVFAPASSITDSRDGERYTTIKIGTTEWIAENLRYKVQGSRCINDFQEVCGIGRYYNFDMAIQACPNGWHLPSKKEWNEIFDKADKSFGLFLLGYCYEDEICFDIDKTASFWTSSDDNGSWTSGRRSDSFLKSMVPRRQKAFAIRYETVQGAFVNPSHSFLKDAYFFNVRCIKD